MSRESEELKARIEGLTDDQLLTMVTKEATEYRQEALDFAKAELTSRGIDFSEAEGQQEPSQEIAPGQDIDRKAKSGSGAADTLVRQSLSVCAGCGQQWPPRKGVIVAEKELTIVFDDNREERFVRVNVCTECGLVSLLVDFDTDVQQ